jgi:hypothetical protein
MAPQCHGEKLHSTLNSISGKQLTPPNQLHGNCPTLQLEVLLGQDLVSSEQATYARYCLIL